MSTFLVSSTAFAVKNSSTRFTYIEKLFVSGQNSYRFPKTAVMSGTVIPYPSPVWSVASSYIGTCNNFVRKLIDWKYTYNEHL